MLLMGLPEPSVAGAARGPDGILVYRQILAVSLAVAAIALLRRAGIGLLGVILRVGSLAPECIMIQNA
jgi:hypothetical protein